jgi:RNase P/RNase MRP subunit POP5
VNHNGLWNFLSRRKLILVVRPVQIAVLVRNWVYRHLTPPKLLDSVLFQSLVDTCVRQMLGTVRWGLLTFEIVKFDQVTGTGVIRVAER